MTQTKGKPQEVTTMKRKEHRFPEQKCLDCGEPRYSMDLSDGLGCLPHPQQPAQPTPGPWRYSRTHAASADTWYVVTDAEGYGPIVQVGGNDVNGQIAEAKYLITNPATIEANARRIVQAVNSHDAMLEALEGLFKLVDGGAFLDLSDADATPIASKLRAALKLARGE